MPAAFNSDALYLALETSGPVGSVAVAAGARVLARALLDSQVRCAADLILIVNSCPIGEICPVQ